MTKIIPPTPLTGAEIETLWCLFAHGPTWDGEVPSKAGRSALFDRGLVQRYEGWNWLTDEGVRTAVEIGLGEKKDKWQRERAR